MILSMWLVLSSCRNNSSEPPGPVIHGDYAWTAQTISYPGSYQTDMQAMWASSPRDIYIVGHNDTQRGHIYHFNGSAWTEVALQYGPGGSIEKPPDLADIHGTSSSDIWAVGALLYGEFDSTLNTYVITDSSFTMHFDGRTWKQSPAIGGRGLQTIWCINSGDAWAAGNSTLFHFDGASWTKQPVDSGFFYSSITGNSASNVFMVGNRSDHALPIDSSGYFLFHFNGASWERIDSVLETPGAAPPHFGRSLWTNGIAVYSLGTGIYRRDGTHWTKIAFVNAGKMYMSHSNNIIAVGQFVYYFNGAEWKEYRQFNINGILGWSDCYTDGVEAFIVGNNNHITTILHGK